MTRRIINETLAKLHFPPLGEKSFPRRREPSPFPLDGGRLGWG